MCTKPSPRIWLPGLIALLMTAVAAHAQPSPPTVDRLFRVSGAVDLRVSGAAPGPRLFTFAIHDTEEGGPPLWEEVQTVRVEADGRYSALIGAGSADGVPTALFATGEPRWLATTLLDGSAPPSRVLLTSVPYAVRAATAGNAETLAGRPASDFQLTPDAWRRSAPAASDDGASVGTREAGPRVNNGTANYIGKFQNTVDLVNSVMFENAGRIGVGTTTPLDVVHARFTDAAGGMTGLAVQNLSSGANAYSGMLFYDHTGALAQFQGFNNSTREYRINNVAAGGSISFMLAGTTRFRIAPGGNVGLGTSTPSSPLHVTGAIRSDLQFNVGGNRVLATPGTENLVAGALAGTALSSGAQNTVVGHQAGAATTTGTTNTMVGRQAGFSNVTGTGNTFVGESAGRLVTASANTVVGQGAARVTTTGADNVFVGQDAAANNATGSFNTFLGEDTGASNTSGSGNTLVGNLANVGFGNLTNAAAIGANAIVTQSNSLVLGSVTGLNGATADTAVGIGTTAPVDRLHVTADIRIGSGSTGCVKDADATVIAGTCASDLRFKDHIRPFAPMLDKVARLRPVTFTWRAAEFPSRAFGPRESYGLIAQDVETVLPELVTIDAEGYRAVNYSRLPLVTIQALTELKAENDALRAAQAALLARLEALERAAGAAGATAAATPSAPSAVSPTTPADSPAPRRPTGE